MADIGWYNGWSAEERRATSPVQKQAAKDGRLARPTHCSICGCKGSRDWRAEDAVWFHDENYTDPLAAYPVCRRCHRTLHRRFEEPEPWLELVEVHGQGGTRWFELLTMDPDSRTRPFAETYPDGLPPG